MVLSLNVTRIALHILRDGILNKQILKGTRVAVEVQNGAHRGVEVPNRAVEAGGSAYK
jgi:hypothetical protein